MTVPRGTRAVLLTASGRPVLTTNFTGSSSDWTGSLTGVAARLHRAAPGGGDDRPDYFRRER